MGQKVSSIYFLCLLGCMLLMATPLKADGNDVLNRVIELPKSKGTVYKLLGQISDRSGFLFIYDSKVVDNDRETRIKSGRYTIRQAIEEIIDNNTLQLRVVGKHILIAPPEVKEKVSEIIVSSLPVVEEKFLTVEGLILDRYTNEPIPFATIGIPAAAIGTITNLNGEFRFLFPDSLRNEKINFSHIGYDPYEIDASLLEGSHHRMSLEPKVIPLQEVVVRLVNPEKLLDEMLESRALNYASRPVFHTSFYREGVEYKKGLVSLTEAVFQIYKTPFDHPVNSDQARLLKMRKINSNTEKDTIITKFKSGVHTTLLLDIVKNLPDFLTKENRLLYEYAHSDITVIDNRLAHVISFVQKAGITDPLYKGEVYIDADNNALLGATFEINPKYINKAANMYIERKSRNLNITPQQIRYTISYKNIDGTYYINHIRGDLYFRIRQKRHLFSTTAHTWFEMINGKTETENVKRFERRESFPTKTVFADMDYTYDNDFWENFNTILPEENLNEAIGKISSFIEETQL